MFPRLQYGTLLVLVGTALGCSASPHDLVGLDALDALVAQLEHDPDCVHTRDALEKTPLFFAVQYKRLDAMEALVAHGADVNAVDRTGMTPLHAAAMYGRREAAEWLLAHGADAGAADQFGDTPLHTAAIFGQGGVVKALRSAGVSLTAENADGRTPLMLAERHRQERFAAYLRKLR